MSKKRFNLTLPADLLEPVQAIAVAERVPTVTILRRFVKLGLLVTERLQHPGAKLLIREGDGEEWIILLL